MSGTSDYRSSGTLSIRSNPFNLFVTSTVQSERISFSSYLNGLVVFPTFFSLPLNLAISSSCSKPQSTPGLVFADCIELLHLWLQEYNQSDFGIDHLVMAMCRDFSCVVGRGCLL